MAGKIFTVAELAEHLNVHRITIYRLLKDGALPGFKIGRVWRFDLDEIANWMASARGTRELATTSEEAASFEVKQDGARPRPSRARARPRAPISD